MLNIIFLILKIIGITIAVILGLLLFIVFAVLFVPIRYEVDASFADKKPKAIAKVTWFLSILRINVSFIDSKLDGSFKALFFTLYDMNGEEKKSQKSKKQKSKKDKKVQKKTENSKENTSASKGETSYNSNIDKEISRSDSSNDSDSSRDVVSSKGENLPIKKTNVKIDEVTVMIDSASREDKANVTSVNLSSEENVVFDDDTSQDNKESIKDKISNFIEKIRQIFVTIKNKVLGIVETVKGLLDKTKESKEKLTGKIEQIKGFLNDENHKEVYRFLLEQTKKLLKIIKPKRAYLKGSVGFENPATTGQVFMYLAILNGFSGWNIEILPDFDNPDINVEFYMKGAIPLYGIVIILLKMYFNKKLKQTISDLKSIK